jgi:Fur family zinc uptake transcriptional regulator
MKETAGTDTTLTKNQELVRDALSRADGPLGAYDLLDRLRDNGFRAPLQVYRALDKLQALGLVHRVESLNAFVACCHADEAPRGLPHGEMCFAICQGCGSVTEFADETALRALQHWALGHEFRILTANTEIKGLCRTCAS